MSSHCFEHRLSAEPAPVARHWRAELGGPIATQSEKMRKTWPSPRTFGLNDEMIWTSGGTVEARVNWALLSAWTIEGDWLILSVTGLPCLYYPLAQLRAKGLYPWVMKRLESVEE